MNRATTGTKKYGMTSTKADEPSDSLFIKVISGHSDWRVNPDDTLWASESSANNVCPAGYRLPLNPNGADDAEHELAVEIHSWDSEDADGAISSDLKLTLNGYDYHLFPNSVPRSLNSTGNYWSGSVVPSDGNNSTVSYARDIYFGHFFNLLDSSDRTDSMGVRCIKD